MTQTLDYTLSLGDGQTGLSLKAQIVSSTGANVGAEITTGFTELGGGDYLAHITTIPDGHRGAILFRLNDGTHLMSASINPQDLESGSGGSSISVDDILGHTTAGYPSGSVGNALNRIGTVSITVVSPVSEGGRVVTLIRGNSYKAEDGCALVFTITSESALPNLTGAVPHFRAGSLDKAGTLTPIDATSCRVSFDLTGAETQGLNRNTYTYSVDIVQPDQDDFTLLSAMLRVRNAHT